jgi:sugar-specific transcriptional regulator TrmB
MLTKQLQQLGLTDGEAKVYEALVALGSTKVGPIVKRSGVAYSNVYDVLNRLQEKGLVTHITREKTKFFDAVPPHRLHEYLEQREKEVVDSKRLLAEILPALTSLQHGKASLLDAEVFVGTSGLRTAYDVLFTGLSRGDEALYFYQHDESYTEFAFAFYQTVWPKMRRAGLRLRGIGTQMYKKTALAKRTPSFLQERYVSFPVPGTIDIAKDKVLIIAWSDKPVAILIRSDQVARNFRVYFEAVWKMAKR